MEDEIELMVWCPSLFCERYDKKAKISGLNVTAYIFMIPPMYCSICESPISVKRISNDK